jgi:SLT domain-containing protein
VWPRHAIQHIKRRLPVAVTARAKQTAGKWTRLQSVTRGRQQNINASRLLVLTVQVRHTPALRIAVAVTHGAARQPENITLIHRVINAAVVRQAVARGQARIKARQV